MTTKELHDYKERAFDAFCRTVIRNESADALRDLAEKSEHEIEMSMLPRQDQDALSCTDQYLGKMEVGADEETVVDRHIITALDGVGRCDDGSRQHREYRFVMRLQVQSTVHSPPSPVHRIHA